MLGLSTNSETGGGRGGLCAEFPTNHGRRESTLRRVPTFSHTRVYTSRDTLPYPVYTSRDTLPYPACTHRTAHTRHVHRTAHTGIYHKVYLSYTRHIPQGVPLIYPGLYLSDTLILLGFIPLGYPNITRESCPEESPGPCWEESSGPCWEESLLLCWVVYLPTMLGGVPPYYAGTLPPCIYALPHLPRYTSLPRSPRSMPHGEREAGNRR